VFLVKRGTVLTPHADSCLPGITRSTVIDLCRGHAIPIVERNLSISEVYTADEMFTTGTMGELSPVLEVDGRKIGPGAAGALTQRLQGLHAEWVRAHGHPIPKKDE
jgi:branched-subunit amino acid aminotransferase/4-amino-4-deoxychorismate lyase